MSFIDRLRAAIDETEAWARAASQTYRYADEGSKVPEGGVHWQWVIGEDWEPVTPDPVTMELLEGADGSWAANLATVEQWPSTMRIDDERTRTSLMPRTYANSIEEMDPAAAGHIIRHDPAAVLRRCAADRSLLVECERILALTDSSLDYSHEERQMAEFVVERLADAYDITPAGDTLST
jgi:hypothetical protein